MYVGTRPEATLRSPIYDFERDRATVHAEWRERARIPEDPLHRESLRVQTILEVEPIDGVDVEQILYACCEAQPRSDLVRHPSVGDPLRWNNLIRRRVRRVELRRRPGSAAVPDGYSVMPKRSRP